MLRYTAPSLKTCYEVALKARSLYAGAYHQNSPVLAAD